MAPPSAGPCQGLLTVVRDRHRGPAFLPGPRLTQVIQGISGSRDVSPTPRTGSSTASCSAQQTPPDRGMAYCTCGAPPRFVKHRTFVVGACCLGPASSVAKKAGQNQPFPGKALDIRRERTRGISRCAAIWTSCRPQRSNPLARGSPSCHNHVPPAHGKPQVPCP